MKRKIKPVFQLEQLEPRLLLNAVPYIQDFSLGKPDAASGWDFYSDNEGRIEVVSGRLRMDDIAGNTTYSSNEAILHVDLTGKTDVTLTLDHWNLSDENDALPDSFAGHYKGDGIALSVDGQNWVKVTDLTISFTNQSFKLDSALEQAKNTANSSDVSDVQIKFQQYDNYSASTDGREFDNIIVNFTNQAPVISSVTASPSTISDSQTSQLQVTATDLDGPNALTYSWTVPSGHGSLDNLYIANPIYTPPDVSSTQTFTLTVKVSDGAAISSKAVDITVTDAGTGPQILLSDDFADGNYNGWSLVDQGTLAGPMAWSAASGVMVQSSNVHSSLSIDPVAKLGTYAYWQAGTGWTDYTAAVTIKSTDNDAIGIMFRYQDENNYYRFIWDQERNSRQLVKCKNGVFSILAEDSVPYVTGKSYQVKIAAQGSSLQVSIDGSPVFSVNDSSFSSGSIALYSWGNAGSNFDNILVEGLSGANQAPVVSVTATPSTISDSETSQLQVTASDPDGPNALTYSWTVPSGHGTLDNLYIANPIYTPPDVSSTQIFTLTVKVSDGAAITTKTVDITVTDAGTGPQILLSDDFTDNNYTGWSLVDQGTMGGSMAWSAVSGVMIQSSNVHSSISIDPVAKLGTYAYWQAGTGWTDYTASVTIKSTDNDALGVMFRYQDENNYYRFIWDQERNSRQLVKCKNGVFSILAEDSVPYVTGKSYQVKIAAQGSLLNISIDGSPVFSVNDSTFSSGTIALYSWGNAGSYFDNIIVEGLSGTNQAPVVSVTASPSTISDTQTSQLQVTATDLDGPNALTYSWTVPSGQGSLDNLYIANPIYTPPDVSTTEIFTLTVKVSDGAAITSKTVDITVTDTFAGPQILLSEDFTDGNYTGWSLVDQGTLAGPMAWSVTSGVMVQSSNVHSSISVDPVAKLGTYAYWQAGTGWTDYTATVTIKSTDNDAIGVMFRYQNENNYYRFIWDQERNSRQLVKCENGVFSILAEDSVPYVTGKSYQVKIAAQGSLLNISIDGSPVFSVNDSTFSSGSIALYSWGNAGSYFDNILVEGSNTTPPAVTNTYSIEAFQFSQPQLADWVGPNPVGDRADTIAQIGNEQTWFCFDISEIPDSEQIISATFTVRMRDYVDNATTQRTLWYDPDDSWAFTWYHDPDYYTPKTVTELISVINFNHDGWTWITTDVDITQHDWSQDLLDNYVTFMLTGPLNGYYVFGDAGFDGAVLVVETL